MSLSAPTKFNRINKKIIAEGISSSIIGLIIVPVFLGLFFLLIELLSPSIRTIQLIYIPFLFISLLFRRAYAPFIFAFIFSLFISLGLYLATIHQLEYQTELFSRYSSIVIVWITALLLYKLKKNHQQLIDITDHLDDLVNSRTAELHQEITNRKNIELELRKREERLNLLMETTLVAVWEWDVVNDKFYWDKTMYTMFNIPEKQRTDYHDFVEYIHPDDKDHVNKAFKKTLEHDQPLNLEFRVIWKDQSIHHVIMRSIVNHEDQQNVKRFYGICFDITEQRVIEEELQKSEERFKNTIYYAPFPAIIHAEDGEVLMINKTWTDITGFKQDDIPTLDGWIQKAFPANINQMKAIIDNINYNTNIQHEEDYEITTQHGEKRTWSFYSSPLKTLEDGRRVLLTMANDITESVVAHDKLEATNVDLEKIIESRTKELESFCYSISHDLRAPLRHISGFIELLEREVSDLQNEQVKHYISIIKDASNKLGILIDELLTFSRMSRAELNCIETDVNEIVQSIIAESETEWSSRNVVWEVEEMPSACADPILLRSVFYNLITNSLKYTKKIDQPVIQIRANMLQDKVVYSVKDNGIGFDMKYANKLFQVFQRLHSSDEYKGTGIGLATVKKIIQRHGGECWAESELGKGAEFFFTLHCGGAK